MEDKIYLNLCGMSKSYQGECRPKVLGRPHLLEEEFQVSLLDFNKGKGSLTWLPTMVTSWGGGGGGGTSKGRVIGL